MKKILFSFTLLLPFFVFTQNTGIGTATPVNKLHVHSGTLADVSIGITNNLTTDGVLRGARLRQVDYDFVISNNEPTGNLSLTTNNFERLTILSNGNVGIGATTPSQKFDVNGNINVSGNIQVNNIAGQPNQVLMTNGSGNTFWGDMGVYKKMVSFDQNGNWVVPAGVTKIRIEAWGGGGGGAIGGGGAGGNYLRTSEITVVPAANITITIGAGGAGASTDLVGGSAGGTTLISGTFNGVFGTYDVSPGLPGLLFQGGSGIDYGLGGQTFIQLVGMSGSTTIYEYTERTAGQFVEIAKNGSGGGVAPFYNNGNGGGMYVKDLGTNTIIKNTYPSGTKIHGTGGGGGSTGTAWGRDGMKGLAIIYY